MLRVSVCIWVLSFEFLDTLRIVKLLKCTCLCAASFQWSMVPTLQANNRQSHLCHQSVSLVCGCFWLQTLKHCEDKYVSEYTVYIIFFVSMGGPVVVVNNKRNCPLSTLLYLYGNEKFSQWFSLLLYIFLRRHGHAHKHSPFNIIRVKEAPFSNFTDYRLNYNKRLDSQTSEHKQHTNPNSNDEQMRVGITMEFKKRRNHCIGKDRKGGGAIKNTVAITDRHQVTMLTHSLMRGHVNWG